ncbi:hypothetical protein A4G28_08500 [Mycobacterium ostraviense]|uniref:Uncharacterized protein n=1 Tax=Mycobacterium ostraviense TaxID=2738409 RepID=A0A164ACS2_9MYCO|nr:hypothetical protein A4G28_08500 [Mycobacterium ostraviense]
MVKGDRRWYFIRASTAGKPVHTDRARCDEVIGESGQHSCHVVAAHPKFAVASHAGILRMAVGPLMKVPVPILTP